MALLMQWMPRLHDGSKGFFYFKAADPVPGTLEVPIFTAIVCAKCHIDDGGGVLPHRSPLVQSLTPLVLHLHSGVLAEPHAVSFRLLISRMAHAEFGASICLSGV